MDYTKSVCGSAQKGNLSMRFKAQINLTFKQPNDFNFSVWIWLHQMGKISLYSEVFFWKINNGIFSTGKLFFWQIVCELFPS